MKLPAAVGGFPADEGSDQQGATGTVRQARLDLRRGLETIDRYNVGGKD